MAWGRIVEVTVGSGAQPGAFVSGLSVASAAGGGQQAQQGQVIRDLHMSFKVKKALGRGAGAPTAELKIYNMSKASYFHFVKINNAVMLAVGYQDESVGASVSDSTVAGGSAVSQQTIGIPLTLFAGAIRFCRRYREKADWVVYIEAEAGMWSIGGAPYTVSMLPGVTAYALLANLATTMKVSVRNLITVPQAVYSGGFSFIGTVQDFLQKVCDFIGFNFVIDGGEITLIPPLSQGGSAGVSTETSTPSASAQGIYLSKDTGLLQPPEPEQVSVGIPDATAGVDGGSQTLPEMRWKITSLILPQVGPGQVMLVKSDAFASGIAYMMVEEIEFDGDNRKDDWKMEALCIPVDSSGQQTQVAAA
jgi:hypothetical protein